MVEKFKVCYSSVSIDTNYNQKGDLFNKLYVNFVEGEEFFRCGEFLEFAEKKLLKIKHPNIDLATIQNLNVSDNINSVECCVDSNKYGEKFYLLVNFGTRYGFQIPIKGSEFDIISELYRIKNVVSVSKVVSTVVPVSSTKTNK